MFLLSSSRVNGVGKITYVGSSLPPTVEQADRCVATFFSKNGGSCSLDEKSWGREFIQFVFSVCLVYVCVCGGAGGCPTDTKEQSADPAFTLVTAVLVQTHNPSSKILNSKKLRKPKVIWKQVLWGNLTQTDVRLRVV